MSKTSTFESILKPAKNQQSSCHESIVLVGMMGSGKSAVGRGLAKKLQLKFADSDQLVTKMAGISIAEIFDLAGEAKFRDMEFRAIKRQLQRPPHVLATGGGAFCEPQTAALLCKKALVIWLQASPETLLKRIGDISSRPMLQTGPPLRVLEQLYASREIFYSRAHIHVNTDGLPVPKAIAALVGALDSHRTK